MGKQRKPNRDHLSSWQERNPLRLWRLKQPPEGWNRSVLARQLDVSHTSVEAWEKGKRLPLLDAFAKIEKLTGITSQQWMDWFDSESQGK
jgi:ribosome-binding protein aMBF1 (putative translation factor)